jgi:hypothetical protein
MRAVVAGLAVLVAAACSGAGGEPSARAAERDQESPTAQAAGSDPPSGPADVVVEFFDLLARNDPSTMPRMLELATEGSPAHLYAQHQIAGVRRRGSFPPAVERCTVFADFQVNAETDLLEGFSVDGDQVADRISTGQPVTQAGLTAKVTTCYQTAAGDLAVHVDVTNALDASVTLADYDWLYVASDGRQHPTDQTYITAPTVASGATAAHAVLFGQVGAGGELTVVAHPEPMGDEIQFEIPTA